MPLLNYAVYNFFSAAQAESSFEQWVSSCRLFVDVFGQNNKIHSSSTIKTICFNVLLSSTQCQIVSLPLLFFFFQSKLLQEANVVRSMAARTEGAKGKVSKITSFC